MVNILPGAQDTMKVRGCIDLRPLNHHLMYRHFMFEGNRLLPRLPHKGRLSDFYKHLRIGGRSAILPLHVRQCEVPICGDAPQPRPCTAIRHLHWLGIRHVMYIDNIILMACSKAKSIRHMQIAFDVHADVHASVFTPEKPLESQRGRSSSSACK